MRKGITGDQIIAHDVDRSSSLILGEYLAAGETLMLYAPTGQGKTVNALMLGIALSTGGTFYDWQAHRPMRVLFVEGGELAALGIAQRMQAIYRRRGITSDPNFHLKAPTRDRPFTFNITDYDHQKKLLQYIEEYDVGCVIFDNYNSLRNEEENEFLAWQRLEKFLNKLKTRNVASVIIHHTNKEGQKQSGAQRKADFCDLVIRIQESRMSTKERMLVEVEMQKFRWGKSAPIRLTEIIFKDGSKEIDLLPVDYEETLAKTVEADLRQFGKAYVKEKFKHLGFRLHHYMNQATPDVRDWNELNDEELF